MGAVTQEEGIRYIHYAKKGSIFWKYLCTFVSHFRFIKSKKSSQKWKPKSLQIKTGLTPINRNLISPKSLPFYTRHVVWEQVYSRGKFVLKASHWSRNVHWDIVVVKSFGGKFASCSDGNYRGLKFSPMAANMKTRLESKIVCNSRKQAVLLTKFGCNIHLAALSKFLIYFCSIRGHVTF